MSIHQIHKLLKESRQNFTNKPNKTCYVLETFVQGTYRLSNQTYTSKFGDLHSNKSLDLNSTFCDGVSVDIGLYYATVTSKDLTHAVLNEITEDLIFVCLFTRCRHCNISLTTTFRKLATLEMFCVSLVAIVLNRIDGAIISSVY